jgi:hypothetical protein
MGFSFRQRLNLMLLFAIYARNMYNSQSGTIMLHLCPNFSPSTVAHDFGFALPPSPL